MTTKKHPGHEHLTGEHRWGDILQIIWLVLFLGIWISDSFVFHYSDHLAEDMVYVRFALALLILIIAWLLARNGMKAVFGTKRDKPQVIDNGVFRFVRHPIYLGAILFCLGMVLFTTSLASAAFLLFIIAGYYLLSRYEERLLTEAFGQEYVNYKKKTGMLFPRLRR